MDERARFEALLLVLDELRTANLDAPVLVEGPRDEASLRALGLAGDIRRVHTGRSLYEECEALAREHPLVIVLTDWDRKGRFLRQEATRAIEGTGSRVDTTFRSRIVQHLTEPVQGVEDLHGYVARRLDAFFHESVEEHLAKARGHGHPPG